MRSDIELSLNSAVGVGTAGAAPRPHDDVLSCLSRLGPESLYLIFFMDEVPVTLLVKNFSFRSRRGGSPQHVLLVVDVLLALLRELTGAEEPQQCHVCVARALKVRLAMPSSVLPIAMLPMCNGTLPKPAPNPLYAINVSMMMMIMTVMKTITILFERNTASFEVKVPQTPFCIDMAKRLSGVPT